ncbi:MAG: hypothetical protein QOE98_1714, partial [Gaiellaceae bacterium]|nr:hypothetical protein [Gaiellaceae bacterium]
GRLPGEYLLWVARFGAAVDARTQAYETPLAAALAVLVVLVVGGAVRRALIGAVADRSAADAPSG